MAISDGQKLFLAVVGFLVLKGLLDAEDAKDRKRVRKTWERYKKDAPESEKMPLFPGADPRGF